MADYDHLVSEYAKRFPDVPEIVHRRIIKGVLGKDATVTESGFRKWYNEVGASLADNGDLAAELLANPHFAIRREFMILGRDWLDTSILERIRERKTA